MICRNPPVQAQDIITSYSRLCNTLLVSDAHACSTSYKAVAGGADAVSGPKWYRLFASWDLSFSGLFL